MQFSSNSQEDIDKRHKIRNKLVDIDKLTLKFIWESTRHRIEKIVPKIIFEKEER